MEVPLLLVDPNKIEMVCTASYDLELLRRHFREGCFDLVRDGDWDIPTQPNLSESDKYKAFEAFFKEGRPWEETAFYRRVVAEIESGITKWGCRTEADFQERVNQELVSLFENIRDHGYKTRKEQGLPESCDEIRVGIDRHGRFVFLDGAHRLICAKLLNLPSVPVLVVVRHRVWQDFKDDILLYAQEHEGRIYHQLRHPDLAQIPALHQEDRFPFIVEGLKDLNPPSEELLDIGSHWGGVCCFLEGLGFKVTGVERDLESYQFACKIRNAQEGRYSLWQGSVFDYPEIEKFSVVIALNIFHHFLKTEHLFQRFSEFLPRIKAHTMIFQAHLHEPPGQMAGAYRNDPPNAFVDLICQKAGFHRQRLLGTAWDGRPVFLLQR